MKQRTEIFKALGDETRLIILDMLSCGELCACDIIEGLHLTQPTISHHMKTLQQVDLVKSKKEGKWMKYNINKEKIEEIKNFLDYTINYKEDCICNKTYKNKEEIK